MPYSISLPRAISALSLLTLVSSGCSCDSERARGQSGSQGASGRTRRSEPRSLGGE